MKKERVYGYARISRPSQNIERQIRNITEAYPNVTKIYTEAYTGTKINRKQLNNLLKVVKEGDTIVFDSVSRMSRTKEEGVKLYFKLMGKGINLVFLKEPMINTSVYQEGIDRGIQGFKVDTGTEYMDEFINGQIKLINKLMEGIATEQIEKAFEQAEKEVKDLQQRTKEGIETARREGKQIGQQKGRKLNVKKATEAKEKILKHSKKFGGNLNDTELQELCNISRNTLYKYKKELEREV